MLHSPGMRLVRGITAVVTLLLVPLLVMTTSPAAVADPAWAPAGAATIHPGVQTFSLPPGGNQCTANFIFADGTEVYIGQAAHCSGTGGNTATDGCTSPSLPLGSQVKVEGASRPGVMVYNSWLTMQALNETDSDTCRFNDLALVRVDPADVARVNPSIPFWGGPMGLNSAGTTLGQFVYSYGNSELRLGISQLSPKKGISLGDAGSGWSHNVSTVTPGVPGDSGSCFLDTAGNALGVVSTLNVGLPGGVFNGIGDLSRELAYMHAHTSLTGVHLVLGDVPFNGNRLPVG
ncbi:MAG: serine protease [Actinomycetota bacterium]